MEIFDQDVNKRIEKEVLYATKKLQLSNLEVDAIGGPKEISANNLNKDYLSKFVTYEQLK